jgi:hypothetical protein
MVNVRISENGAPILVSFRTDFRPPSNASSIQTLGYNIITEQHWELPPLREIS